MHPQSADWEKVVTKVKQRSFKGLQNLGIFPSDVSIKIFYFYAFTTNSEPLRKGRIWDLLNFLISEMKSFFIKFSSSQNLFRSNSMTLTDIKILWEEKNLFPQSLSWWIRLAPAGKHRFMGFCFLLALKTANNRKGRMSKNGCRLCESTAMDDSTTATRFSFEENPPFMLRHKCFPRGLKSLKAFKSACRIYDGNEWSRESDKV